jgi:hypothetical protein
MAVNLLEAYAGVWMDSPKELIAGVRRGDENAFQLIFEQHHRFVFRFLYGMVGERRLAEELTQETFMQAYKNIGTLREETKTPKLALRNCKACRPSLAAFASGKESVDRNRRSGSSRVGGRATYPRNENAQHRA